MKARVWLLVAAAVLVAFVVVAASNVSSQPATGAGHSTTSPALPAEPPVSPVQTDPPQFVDPSSVAGDAWRPTPVFRGRLLVAYYGTAGTGSMGVLGSGSIPHVTAKLRDAAQGFAEASGRKVQIVYELIATMTDSYPGDDGNYSHDIPRADVQAYLNAARRNHALLVLDLQPGRSDFLTVAKRYAWALKLPNVSIALDPEWRMHGDDVPGEQLGWVSADEINATARYVATIAREHRLPQKLFLIHQFVPQSVYDIAAVQPEKGLAMVQHVDGWGAQVDKLATYHAVARPAQFTMGFKLFYRNDVDLMTPAQVLRAVPRVRFFSYQ